MLKSLLIRLIVAAIFALSVTLPTSAQPYPTKPIRMIIGFAAGGPTDVIGRLIAKDMSVTLGQQVVVENRTGANALIATEVVARAEPDGYTVLLNSLNHNVNALLMKEVKYHPLKDFAPVSLVAILPLLLVTQADSPLRSVQDLVAFARAKPNEVNYGSAGNGGSAHLAAALLQTSSNTKMIHIPFRGNAPALSEVIAGRVSFMFYPIIGVADQVAGKQLKVLAAATAKRHPDFPSVPTMAESGFPGFEETAPWVGLFAPAGTPATVVDALYRALAKSLIEPETQERLKALGAISAGSTPQDFTAFLQKDSERWARVIAAAGIKAE